MMRANHSPLLKPYIAPRRFCLIERGETCSVWYYVFSSTISILFIVGLVHVRGRCVFQPVCTKARCCVFFRTYRGGDDWLVSRRYSSSHHTEPISQSKKVRHLPVCLSQSRTSRQCVWRWYPVVGFKIHCITSAQCIHVNRCCVADFVLIPK